MRSETSRRRRRAALLALSSIGLTASATTSRLAEAEPATPSGATLALPNVVMLRPIGGFSPAGYAAGEPYGGALVAVEGGWATMLGADGDPSHGAWTLGARAGWAFPNGITIHARYDDLGVEPGTTSSPIQLASAGLRYSVPFFVPMPFAEVDAGPAFVAGDPRFAAGVALGASVPVGAHVLVDIVGHDWLFDVAGTLRQTLTAGLGLAVTFGSQR